MTVSLLNRSAVLALASVLIFIIFIPACSSNGSAPQGDLSGDQHPANPALESELRAELIRQLEAAGIDSAAPARYVSSVPAGGTSEAYLYSPANVYWQDGIQRGTMCSQVVVIHRLAGDTDNNGQVNISDITPLATYWQRSIDYEEVDGQLIPAGEPGISIHWRASAADTDRNGEVNLADVTPIARNWGAHVTGYEIRRLDSASQQMTPLYIVSLQNMDHGDAVPQHLFDDVEVNDPVEEYEVAPVFDVPVETYWGVGTDNIGPPTPTIAVPIDVPSVVVVEPDEPEGEAPHTVVIDAGSSTDLNSPELVFDFDLVGIEEEALDQKLFTDPSEKSFTLTEPGTYIVRVSVRDTDIGETITTVDTSIVVTEPVSNPGPGPELP